MTEDRRDTEAFEGICRKVLAAGGAVRFQARGASMSPAIRDGEMVMVRPLGGEEEPSSCARLDSRGRLSPQKLSLQKLSPQNPAAERAPKLGDVLLVRTEHGLRLHRLVRWNEAGDVYVTRGDCGQEDDAPVRSSDILGIAECKEMNWMGKTFSVGINSLAGRWVQRFATTRTAVARRLGVVKIGFESIRSIAAVCALLIAVTTLAGAQVAVDSTNSRGAEFTGPGPGNFTRNHTTTGTNLLLVVGVDMNIANAPTSTVSGITYNGTNLTFLGAHNDAGNTRRVEIWSLLAPAAGVFPISVNINIPVAQTIGVVFGATTFTGVDQTVPIGGFYSADGAAGANSQLDVPSVVNGMILDALATGGDQTVTVPGPQVQLYNRFTGGGTDPPDVNGSGSSRTGAPSVPISEIFSGTSNWSLGAVSINPTSADIGVSTTVNAVQLGQNSVYNITVRNSGPSTATGVSLTDTLAAGPAFVSVTASAGVTCAGTGPIVCAIGTLASAATATVTVTVTAAAAGYYPNTASVTDSGTPPDPNTGNNTYVALAPVQNIACSPSMLVAGGTLTGTVNTYYPGTASVAAGAKSIPVGAATGGAGVIAAGSLLLVIQMQDASINTSNSVAYGNGSTGTGFTAVNNAGNYEFVTATGPVSGGAVPVTGAGAGAGLVFGYTNAAWSATKGQSIFQVVLVPQYTSATLGAGLTASAWNGSTGGILALDVAGGLSLGGAVVSVDGLGFRGGAGLQLVGGVGGNSTDFLFPSPAAYAGAAVNGADATKGEGIAGTPLWVESGGTFFNTGSGYPSGAAGVDGSSAHGAPGNAGGGGTDSNPANNDQNAGGGGGANGGVGGFGGDSWNTNLSSGGEGGSAVPVTIDRIALGGGGGAGSRNNSPGDLLASSGAAGGGLVFIRAGSLTGTATLTANGLGAYNGTSNDAGGGGGAGGAIVVLSANGGENGLTLQAQGGRGGDAWDSDPYKLADRHGPGGGGGGGVVLTSGAAASIGVLGGASGTTLTPGVAYGATAGSAGISATTAALSQVTGVQSGALCTPDLTLGKSHVGNFVRGTLASYTVPVSNVSPFGATNGQVTINDTLPLGLTPASATGIGWTCSTVSQTVSCVRSDALAANSSYPAITLSVNVTQTAPAVISNTAQVSGGAEINLLNDTATDVASVVSTADLSVGIVATPNPVTAGNNITYTVAVNDLGPSAADNATLVFPTPANTTFVSVTIPAGWSCITPGVGVTGNVVCTILSMAGGTSANFSLAVKVNAGTANGTAISGTASVSSSVNDPVLANNSATATTIVGTTAGADLSVTNAAAPSPVIAGNNITYTQVVSNTGAVAATTATFTENTPANTTFQSLAAPAGWTCSTPAIGATGAISCTDPSVASGSTGTFTLAVKVGAATASGTVISDTVTVNASNDSFAGDNSATVTDVVATAGQADLALSTAATPLNVLSGNNITYTQTITNNGPAAATTASFTEATPAYTTFQSVSAPAGWTCTTPAVGATGNVNCTNPSMAAGTSADIFVVVNVGAGVAAGTITANSSVSSATTDPNLANNSTTVTTNDVTACDLTTTNSGIPNPVAAGNNISYTQTVANAGPSNCAAATFTEVIPANTTFQALTPVSAGWTCVTPAVGATGTISCTNPSVAPGATASFPVVVKVNAGVAAGTLITDTATAATTTRDTNPADNSATSIVAVAGAGQADLSVVESASPNPVTSGSNITYAQVVSNAGPSAANTLTFTETIPPNTTFLSLTVAAGWTCTPPAVGGTGSFSCTIATLAAGASANFTLVAKVNTNVAPGTNITDTASISSTTSDPNNGNNTTTATVQVGTSADLSVTATANPVPVQASANIAYTQTVTNAGPSSATNTSFTETVPANTTFVSLAPVPVGWSCVTPAVGATGTITCTNPSFAPGSASFPLVVKVNAGVAAGTAINETASVSSTTSDPNLANNSATAADVVATNAQADLITTNSASPSTVAAGANVTYTQTVTNNGPAAATAPTFSETIPPNETFQSIVIPAGWSCVTPAVGGTGTISCTDGSSLAVNATATFTVVLQVNSGTASGTNIADTVTASASNIVPGITTNSATATVLVANANSADVQITKTGTPNPVPQGGTLTYTLTVKNAGPATATNVTATDILPNAVTYLSAVPSQGTCSQAGGTVTCPLGTMANGATATVAILTIAASPGVVLNTAIVTASQTDPNLFNNLAIQTETITFPTRIQLQQFQAGQVKDAAGTLRTVLTWKTSGEAHNLGFNVYRDDGGTRVRLNPSLIAGSALLMNGALPKHGARTYRWLDTSSPTGSGSMYWLEDVDVSGARTLHGPVPVASLDSTGELTGEAAALLSAVSQAEPPASFTQVSHPTERTPHELGATGAQNAKQFELAAAPAVKLYLKREGWYRVTQPELVKKGLDPSVDPALLQLYAEAIQQPIEITGATPGVGGFGPGAAISFYGTGMDTQYTGTRVYWLVAGHAPGLRIQRLPASTGSNLPPTSFLSSIELKPRTTYFAALLTKDGDNFFGPLVSLTPLDQNLFVAHLDPNASASARLEVTLRGVIAGNPHDVRIALNGTTVGDLAFVGQQEGRFQIDLPPGALREGANGVTLTAQNGQYDYSLVDIIRIAYPHKYFMDLGKLEFTGRAGEEVAVRGSGTGPAVLLDITDPDAPVALTPDVTTHNGRFELKAQIPWNTTSSSTSVRHTLLAVDESLVGHPLGLRPNHPSHWHSRQPGADIAMVTAETLAYALKPLVKEHSRAGKSSVVVPVTEIFDEFNFGERSPYAIRDFLRTARTNWTTPPTFLLLNGRASLDPRNYLGFGHLDIVPTKIVSTPVLMTASDDWFSDFSETSTPTLATGRLPVSTPQEADLVVAKIASYAGTATNGSWTSQALIVADRDDGELFSQDSLQLQAELPSTISATDVFAGTVDVATARQQILSAINSGQLLVNYLGHGSEDQWSGENIFDNASATSLTNGTGLPVFLIMDCLNGFFQDVYNQPLGVTLLLAPNGGAVAVLTSSGLNQAGPQVRLDRAVVQGLFQPDRLTLGEAVMKAKLRIMDPAVRKSYILLGDPAMTIKTPAGTPANSGR